MRKTLVALSVLMVERIIFLFARNTFFLLTNFSLDTLRKVNIKTQLKLKLLLFLQIIFSDWILA
jgi:hypothetical protein